MKQRIPQMKTRSGRILGDTFNTFGSSVPIQEEDYEGPKGDLVKLPYYVRQIIYKMYYSYDTINDKAALTSSLSRTCRSIRAETCKENQRYRINRILAGKKLEVCEGTRYIDRNMLRLKERGKWYGIGFGKFRLIPWMGMNSLHLLHTFSLSLDHSVNLQSSSSYSFLKRLSRELKEVKRIRIRSLYEYGREMAATLENGSIRNCFDVLILYITLPTVTEIFIESLAPWTYFFYALTLKQIQLLLDRLGISYIGEEHEMGYLLKYT